jgi:peptidoglycan-associated lipoprotein
MKIANFFTLLLLSVAVSFTATGCKKNVKSPTPIFGRTGQAPRGSSPGGIENPGPTVPLEPRVNPEGSPLASRPGNLEDYNQDRETFRQDTVYFEFDKYTVKPSEVQKVQSVASYLKGQTPFAVLVEGHCDERGTPEYNRSLGERRALSIRELLISAGVSGDRIHTVSFGEDKPAESGHNEAAWSKNRRGEFVLLRPKSGAGAETR